MKKAKDILNPKNIRNFIEGNYLMWKDKLSNVGINQHIKEQAIYRALLCKDCLISGKCLECGCKTPNMFFSVNKEDSLGRWGKMLNPAKWKQFKDDNNIEQLPDSFNLIKELEDGRHD
jgi:hypothetical protein